MPALITLRRALVIGVIASTSTFVACDDDSSSSNGANEAGVGGGGTGNASGGATGGSETSVSADAAVTSDVGGPDVADLPDAEPPPPLCINPNDEADMGNTYDDGKTITDLAAECASICLAVADPDACWMACMMAATGGAVNQECLRCLRLSVNCTIEHCLGACLAEPGSQGCTDCRCGGNPAGENCNDEYVWCSRIPSDACAGPN